MSRRMRDFLFINLGIGILCLILLGCMFSYVSYVNGHECVYNMGEPPITCTLSVEESKCWSESAHGFQYGIQYDVSTQNLTDVNLRDWECIIQVPMHTRVDSYWSGEFVEEPARIVVTPVEYNKVIEPNGVREFGFILYSDTKDNIENYEIHFYKLISIRDLKAFWMLIAAICLGLVVDIVFLVSEAKTARLRRQKKEYQDIVQEIFLLFSNLIDARDLYTSGHSLRVAAYSRELAKRMGLDLEEQTQVFFVAMLHDIGKIGLPDSVLKKQGRLTPEEFVLIEQHVKIGGDILKGRTAIKGLFDGASYHHERYDGTGYVAGLAGEDIPLVARIICVADAFDAMTSDRCYRKALPLATVVEELKKCTGSQFDPKIVPYMLDMIDDGMAPIDLDKTDVEFYTGKNHGK